MSEDYKEILIEKYDSYIMEEYGEKKKLLRLEIFNILNEENQLDSDDFYIWGLTYYMADEDKKHNKNLALEKFIKAYELDVCNFLACLYIAHCYHDMGDLKNALRYYELVNKNDLKEFQIWRYVKLLEQIGYCEYKLGNEKKGREYFLNVLEWYRKLPIEDRAVPTEMLACLPESDKIIIEIKEIEDYLD